MKQENRLSAFLSKTVNLNQSRLDDLEVRVGRIVGQLGEDETLGPLVLGHVRQGSWAHRTIIKPLPSDEFDADILLRLRPVRDWSREPRRYLDEVDRALRRSRSYKAMTEKKNRCVRVHYANDCHVDVVPYVVRGGLFTTKAIIDARENRFEPTDPESFTAWMVRQDRRAKGNVRKTIRLLKYVRDRNDAFSIPSIILTTLVGNQVHWWWEAADRYRDLPTAFRTLVGDLDAWLQDRPKLPRISDPSGSGTTFGHRWDARRYSHFRDVMNQLAADVREAGRERDPQVSIARWQRIFGPAY